RVEKLEYVDGDVVSYVNRNVTINFDKDIQPFALLGLSFSLPQEPHAQVKTPSFIKQLVDAGEIPQPTVSIHVFKFSVGMNGRLVLGQPLERAEGTTLFPLVKPVWAQHMVAILVSAVWVKGSSTKSRPMGPTLEENSFPPGNAKGELPVAFDSGDDVTTLPRPVFSMVWEAIEAEFGLDRVDGSKMLRFSSKKDKRLTAFVDANGRIWSRKRVIRHLPVIVIKVDDTFTFEVPLTRHVRVCTGSWCRLMVIDAGKSQNDFVLGRPFFAQYRLHVDFGARVVGLTTLRKTVVEKVVSDESWIKHRAPRCKRRVQRSRGVAEVLRRCIGRSEHD
ncbi:hypothetical protein FOZ63_021816, partial [Perkinsus olseni]